MTARDVCGYGQGRRAFYGSVWTFYTLVFIIGGLFAVGGGHPLGLVCLLLGGLCGWYAYRIWTWQARTLTLILIF